MECSNNMCMKRYDIKCLNIASGAFKAYTLAYKKKWVCPDCICLKPKSGNMETPVRTDTADFNITTTPLNNVNIHRGSRAEFSPVMMDKDVDAALLVELRQFRSDIITRLDSQAKAITQLQHQFLQTKTDLDSLVKVIKVIESRVTQTQNCKSQEPIAEAVTKSSPTTFAEAVTQNTSPNILPTNVASNQYSDKTQKVNKRVATKSARSPVQLNITDTVPIMYPSKNVDDGANNQTGWTTVRNKKFSRVPKDVTVGNNTEIKTILATERKKHLHVWRLHPATTVEAMTNHVKSICGQDVVLKVEKIKHKTERDYSSFIIGVPEQMYSELNKAEVWPVKAEFKEWIWFRGYTKDTYNEQQ